jgi:hypothetical protein
MKRMKSLHRPFQPHNAVGTVCESIADAIRYNTDDADTGIAVVGGMMKVWCSASF